MKRPSSKSVPNQKVQAWIIRNYSYFECEHVGPDRKAVKVEERSMKNESRHSWGEWS